MEQLAQECRLAVVQLFVLNLKRPSSHVPLRHAQRKYMTNHRLHKRAQLGEEALQIRVVEVLPQISKRGKELWQAASSCMYPAH